MSRVSFNWLFSIILLVTISCSPTPSINGLDREIWVNDKYACSGVRTEYLSLIQSNRDNLLELSQNQVETLLGSPDEHELDERRRKYFYYYMEPGNHCEDGMEHPVRLLIKFNAVGLSSEVFLENY